MRHSVHRERMNGLAQGGERDCHFRFPSDRSPGITPGCLVEVCWGLFFQLPTGRPFCSPLGALPWSDTEWEEKGVQLNVAWSDPPPPPPRRFAAPHTQSLVTLRCSVTQPITQPWRPTGHRGHLACGCPVRPELARHPRSPWRDHVPGLASSGQRLSSLGMVFPCFWLCFQSHIISFL